MKHISNYCLQNAISWGTLPFDQGCGWILPLLLPCRRPCQNLLPQAMNLTDVLEDHHHEMLLSLKQFRATHVKISFRECESVHPIVPLFCSRPESLGFILIMLQVPNNVQCGEKAKKMLWWITVAYKLCSVNVFPNANVYH